mgnify:CR=1 FL=1
MLGIYLMLIKLDLMLEVADTGKNFLTDPEYQPYKDLVALGSTMVTQESGSGNYTFVNHTTGKPSKK